MNHKLLAEYFYTSQKARQLLDNHKITVPLPTFKRSVMIAFPLPDKGTVNLGELSRTKQKSTCGGYLYRYQLYDAK